MPLRRLEQIIGPSRDVLLPVAPLAPKTAIAFAFDSDYLVPFKVMIYSMFRAGTLLDSSIYIYTYDPAVFEDDVVGLVVDKRFLLEGQALKRVYDIAENNIGRAERAKWNRGTCLKWAVFDDADVDQILFLDVDMICLGSLEELIDLAPGHDLVCCPQFQRGMLTGKEGKVSVEKTKELILELINGVGRYRGRINTGVFIARKNLLSSKFRDRLFNYASKHNEINEQSHLTNLFRRLSARGEHKTYFAKNVFNFHESYLGLIDRIDAIELAKSIKILHYAGSRKPWQDRISRDSRATMQLWWHYFLAAQQDGLLE